jgi:DnaJ-class molecular chaperone
MGGAGAGFNPFGSGVKFTYSNQGGGFGSAFGGADFGDPFDIFEQFFGGASPFRTPRVPRYSLNLDFMDAVKGCQKEVSIGGKKRKIKIPAGVDEGSRINFGDFVLSVNVKPSTLFERDGADLYVRVGIPYSLAALGGEIEVPTIDKPIKIKVRAGTQPGTMIRLRGKGAPIPGGRGSGDEYVRISILVPGKITREQKSIIEELEEAGL